MKIGIIMGFFFIIAGLLFVACVPKTVAPPTVSEKAAPATKTPTGEAWEVEWNNLVATARKEGQVNIASAAGVTEVRESIGKALQTKFGIGMELTIMGPAEVAQKLVMERKAGIYHRDIYIGGSTTILTVMKPNGFLDPIEPNLILPEIRNPAAYWNNELPLTADGHAISIIKGITHTTLINTDLVKEEEIKSYRDLLNPKWKGKILMDDPTTAGSGQKLASYIYIQDIAGGADFLKDFVKQDPTLTRDRRLLSEWVARGKYAIAICSREEMTMPFIDMGAPLKFIIPKEGLYVTHGGQAVTLLNKPLHPNAAKVFLNWIFTKEAGELWSRAANAQSSRVDVSTEFLRPDQVRKPGVKYFDSDNDEFMVKLQEVNPAIKAIFAPVMQ